MIVWTDFSDYILALLSGLKYLTQLQRLSCICWQELGMHWIRSQEKNKSVASTPTVQCLFCVDLERTNACAVPSIYHVGFYSHSGNTVSLSCDSLFALWLLSMLEVFLMNQHSAHVFSSCAVSGHTLENYLCPDESLHLFHVFSAPARAWYSPWIWGSLHCIVVLINYTTANFTVHYVLDI